MNRLKAFIRKFVILLHSLYGYSIKWLYDLHILHIPALQAEGAVDVIVSLTSYGRRVSSGVVCYSIYSILRQTVQPKRIILWLSENEWNDNNLPAAVRHLRAYGVEIRYCEEMYSYKKLFPTRLLYPEADIITVDDDLHYPRTLLKRLEDAHKVYPQTIIVPYLRKVKWYDTHPAPYIEWEYAQPEKPALDYLPLGGSGCWYPASALKQEMIDYKIAHELCPTADDVWFWAAGLANGTKKYSTGRFYELISFDAIYQYFHPGSALQDINVKGYSGLTNDDQIAAALDYLHRQYGITII